MSESPQYQTEHQRNLLASTLPPELVEPFLRLSKSALYGPDFQFLVCELYDQRVRDQVIDLLEQAGALANLQSTRLDLTDNARFPDLYALEAELVELSQHYQIIHLCGMDLWLQVEQPQRWQALNVRRDAIAQTCRACLLCWLSPEQIRLCATEAPDLWSWRNGVYSFLTAPAAVVDSMPIDAHFAEPIDNRSLQKLTKRAAQLRAWLELERPDEIRLQLLDELADICRRTGQIGEALHIYNEALSVLERLGDIRGIAIGRSKIADILQDCGQFDEALRIRTEQELPVYEKLGDARNTAITQGKIADILQARGQLDEALRIRTELQLPVHEKLGDIRETAIARGQIADILHQRGQLAEALRIRTEQELPVYEQLGDIRLIAITQGQIADILQARGQLDEALRIRTEQELPVHEKLGDLRETAITQGKIADILQARGQLDEALRIRTEQELPVYEQLGDIRETAITQGQIADILQARGQLDEALRIRNEQVLPAYQKMGMGVEVAQAQLKIAYLLWQLGQPERVGTLLDEAEAGLQKLGHPGWLAAVADLRQKLAAEAAPTKSQATYP